MKDDRDLLFAFLAGVAVGAAVALLSAPQSGSRTRRQIRRKAEDIQACLEEIGEDLVEKGRELIERGRETAGETLGGIGKKVKEAVT